MRLEKGGSHGSCGLLIVTSFSRMVPYGERKKKKETEMREKRRKMAVAMASDVEQQRNGALVGCVQLQLEVREGWVKMLG